MHAKKNSQGNSFASGQGAPPPHHEKGASDQDSKASLKKFDQAKSLPSGLQPIDLHQRVERLLVYLAQHGFRVSYELWKDQSATVWALRPVDQSGDQIELSLHKPCHQELYFSWAREIVQLV